MQRSKHPDYYQWHYVWSEDNQIMLQSFQKFVSEAGCRVDGEKHHPSYTTFDGPNAPYACLVITTHTRDQPPDTVQKYHKIYRGPRKCLEIWQLALRSDPATNKTTAGFLCPRCY